MFQRTRFKGQDSAAHRLTLELGVITLSRLFLSTGIRFAYPFAAVLSRNLHVPLTAITSLIAITRLSGMLSIVFGPLGDRFGYRFLFFAGLGLLCIGMWTGALFPVYETVLIALFLTGLGKSIFDPSSHAYMGKRAPYQQRGMIFGIMEISWAGSSLIGIPLVGLLIDRFSWKGPFFFLGGAGLLSLVAIWVFIPQNHDYPETSNVSISLLNAWRQIIRKKSALGALCFTFCISAANDNFFVVYGAWLEGTFDLNPLRLGLTTSIIGVAELLGESLTASSADRLGFRRMVIVGVVLSMISYLVLPLIGKNLLIALAVLFFIFLAVEITIVTSLPFFIDILGDAQATMMSGRFTAASVGRAIGAMIGGPIWIWGGIRSTALASVIISCIGLFALIWGIRRFDSE